MVLEQQCRRKKKILGFELATFQSTHRTSITTGMTKAAKLATLSATISTLDWEKTKAAALHLKSYKERRRIVFEQLATPQTSSDGYKTQEKKIVASVIIKVNSAS